MSECKIFNEQYEIGKIKEAIQIIANCLMPDPDEIYRILNEEEPKGRHLDLMALGEMLKSKPYKPVPPVSAIAYEAQRLLSPTNPTLPSDEEIQHFVQKEFGWIPDIIMCKAIRAALEKFTGITDKRG